MFWMTKTAPFAHDEPVDLKRDAFGHADYVRALASMVTDEKPPSTVGVFGPWGVGKSTIIGGLQESLPEETAFAYFDAWRYEDDSLRRQFLRDVAGHLEKEGHLRTSGKGSFTVDRNLQELDVESQTVDEDLKWSKARAKRALWIALPLVAVVLLLLQLGTGDFLSTDKFGQRILVALLVGAVTFALNLYGHVFRIAETRITTPSLKDPDRFSSAFSDLLRALRPKRLVIAVDNLDRCDAETAVEMLSTIKTYLEPTVGTPGHYPISRSHEKVDKEIVFVISVDDAALRRHLIAQELEQSKELDRSREQRVEAARRYVDEYLSKFFSARLPIRHILLDDIREYIDANLDPLIKGRGIEEDRKLLVEFVSAGLRSNPRRVKQFVNDLEARLRLLQEREKPVPDGKPGISSAVSEDVLPVARLALIEAEWPEAFEELERDYRKLDEWETRAKSESAVLIRQPAVEPRDSEEEETTTAAPDAEELASAQRFAAFLRLSSSVSSENLRTLLDLKQASAEAGLPRFLEFRSAVVGDDRAEVERLVEEASKEERRGYAGRMKTILEEEIRDGYVRGARSVVDAMVQVDGLREFREERKDVVSAAVRNPALQQGQLAELDSGPLLVASLELDAEDRGALILQFVARFVAPAGISADETQAIAAGLAPVASEIPADGRDAIQHALEGDLANQFSAYRALVEADPSLLATGVGRAALEALSETTEDGRSTLAVNPDAVAVAIVALPEEEDPDLDDLAVQRVQQVLVDNQEDAESFGFNAKNGLALLETLKDGSEDVWGQLGEHIRDQWPASPIEHRKPLFELLELALSRTDEARRSAIGQGFASNLFAQPDQGVELLKSLDKPPDADLRQRLVGELAQVGGQHVQQRDDAIGLIRSYAAEEAASPLGTLVFVAIQHGDEPGAHEVLDQQKDLLGAQHEQIADQILGWSEANPTSAPLSVLAMLAPAMNPQQEDRLAALFLTRFQAGDDAANLALGELDSNGRARHAETVVLRHSLSFVAGGPQNPANTHPYTRSLSAISPYLHRLDKDGQEELGRTLDSWLDSSLRPSAVSEMQRIGPLRADVARPLVAKLIEIDGTGGDVPTRVAQLAGARAIASGSRRATGDIEAHLSQLREGSEADQGVVNELGPET